MTVVKRLLETTVSVLLTCLLLAGCAPQRKFATDPIYDAGKYRTQTKKKSGRKTTTALSSKSTISSSTKKLDASEAALVAEARKWIGSPYRYGGHSRSGTDCSGFVMEVYRAAAGIELPRSSREQHKFATPINFNNLSVGDLVFFSTRGSGGDVSHVGIFIGDNNMIHASTSRGVIVSGLDEKYYQSTYHSSGRVSKFKKSNDKSATQSTSVKENVEKIAKATAKPATQATTQPKRTAATTPKKVIEIKHSDLDSILNQKIDSVFTNMFD